MVDRAQGVLPLIPRLYFGLRRTGRQAGSLSGSPDLAKWRNSTGVCSNVGVYFVSIPLLMIRNSLPYLCPHKNWTRYWNLESYSIKFNIIQHGLSLASGHTPVGHTCAIAIYLSRRNKSTCVHTSSFVQLINIIIVCPPREWIYNYNPIYKSTSISVPTTNNSPDSLEEHPWLWLYGS